MSLSEEDFQSSDESVAAEAEESSCSEREESDFVSEEGVSDPEEESSPEEEASDWEEDTKTTDFFDPHLERNYEMVVKALEGKTKPHTVSMGDAQYSLKSTSSKIQSNDALLGLKPLLAEYMSNYSCSELVTPLNSFLDVLYTKKESTSEGNLMKDLVVHCLNRIIRTRDRILKNNALLKEKEPENDRLVRDQGFTRPRVLILLPMRNMAAKYVHQFISVFEQAMGGQVENKKRFQDEYELEEEDAVEQKESLSRKPEDYRQLFTGNTDDCFRLGLKVTRKSLKLFSEFYQSDVIIASPLGLKMVIEGEVVKSKKKGGRKRQKRQGDSDFLSSIETLVLDDADVMLMQNWEHVQFAMDHMNQIPKDSSRTDFSRVKSAFLEGKAASLRQTVALARFPFPELRALVERQCQNMFGLARFQTKEYPNLLKGYEAQGVKVQLLTFDAPTLVEDPECRLQRFSTTLFPKLQKYHHVCIFVPTYFDFLRLCKFFKDQEVEYASISEYSDASETTKSRARFFNGHVRFLLVTERFHFYYRLRLRGIVKMVFYGVPEHAEYFGEWVQMLKSSDSKVGRRYELPVIVSPWDQMRLERLIGTKKVAQLFEQ